MGRRLVSTRGSNEQESKPSNGKRKTMDRDGGSLSEACGGRTRGQKTLFEMMKPDDECPSKLAGSASASQQSTDSELHQEQPLIDEENKLSAKINLNWMSKDKQILNSEKDFTQKKLKKSSRIQSKGKVESLGNQTTLNYLKKPVKIEEVVKQMPIVITPQPLRQDFSGYNKAISDMDSEWIMTQLTQFNGFIEQIISNIREFANNINSPQNSVEKFIPKLQSQIRFLLFQFLTGSPFSLWSCLYAPRRVSQLMEESNGQCIQLWVRKYYKDIKDKMKSQSLFGFIDSDEDFSEYYSLAQGDSAIVGEQYESLLRGKMCQSWKGRSNILVLNGSTGCGKTTALRCALNSLRMEVIEISNSQKRGAADLRKITELTQSCRLQNPMSQSSSQSSQSGQPPVKGIGAFFKKSSQKDQSSQQYSQEKDEVKLDTKESNKKVIYFPNFDVILDPLFQSEVFKLADNSKIPFILSISNNEKNNTFKNQGSDEIEFQAILQEHFTYLLYAIFTIEETLRPFHTSPLYIHELYNSQDSKASHDLENRLLGNNEFQELVSKICSNVSFQQISGISSPTSLPLIQKLVKLFRSDLNTCFSFVQFHAKQVSSLDESFLVLKALEYLQEGKRKLNSLSEIFTTPVDSSTILNSKFFKIQAENSYQMHLSAVQKDDDKEDIDLEAYLQQLNTYQTIDILERKCLLHQQQESTINQISKDQEGAATNNDLFFQSNQLTQYKPCNYQLIRLEEDIEKDLHNVALETNQNKQFIVSNFFQNSLVQSLKVVQNNAFIQYYKQYDLLSDRVDRSEKIPIRNSQMAELFSILPVLDTIKTCFLVGTARTRSKQTKELKNIQSNPISIVEQTLTKKTYFEFKLMLSQFNQLNRDSFSQRKYQPSNQGKDQKENNKNIMNTLQIQGIEQMDDFTESVLKTCNDSIHEADNNDLENLQSAGIQIQIKRDNVIIEQLNEEQINGFDYQDEVIQRKTNICDHEQVQVESLEINISQIDISNPTDKYSDFQTASTGSPSCLKSVQLC